MVNTGDVLTRGITNIIPNKNKLEDLLKSGKKLSVYLGIDPTATRIHLGHAVALRKLQQFVKMGHNVTFLIGDFTALIGDTSDKESERPILTENEIKENFKSYKKQAEKIVDFSKVKVRYNSEWLRKLTYAELIKIKQKFSLNDFISRELIKKRLVAGKKVRLDETEYPIMQGYDSYFLNTDIQIGGADQTFNMQAGRTLQKDLRQKESFVLVTGYLEGTDGRKMSKSWGNAIWLNDSPEDMFGKVMSIKDSLIPIYFDLSTSLINNEILEKKKRLQDGENPINLKRELAFQIVKELHSEKSAKQAQENFEKTFQKGEPEYKTQVSNEGNLVDTIAKILGSKSEAKRIIKQNGVDINGKLADDVSQKLNSGDKINLGKRRFFKIK